MEIRTEQRFLAFAGIIIAFDGCNMEFVEKLKYWFLLHSKVLETCTVKIKPAHRFRTAHTFSYLRYKLSIIITSDGAILIFSVMSAILNFV